MEKLKIFLTALTGSIFFTISVLSCHIVTPEECIKACTHKGVKKFSNLLIGLVINSCECKSTYIESKNAGYNIKIEEIKKD